MDYTSSTSSSSSSSEDSYAGAGLPILISEESQTTYQKHSGCMSGSEIWASGTKYSKQ